MEMMPEFIFVPCFLGLIMHKKCYACGLPLTMWQRMSPSVTDVLLSVVGL